MALNITTTQQAKDYLALLDKLKLIDSSTVDVFVNLRSMEIQFKESRDFNHSLANAIVILEKSLYIWLKATEGTFNAVDALNLYFDEADLVGF